jgi:hypothetical protein
MQAKKYIVLIFKTKYENSYFVHCPRKTDFSFFHHTTMPDRTVAVHSYLLVYLKIWLYNNFNMFNITMIFITN